MTMTNDDSDKTIDVSTPDETDDMGVPEQLRDLADKIEDDPDPVTLGAIVIVGEYSEDGPDADKAGSPWKINTHLGGERLLEMHGDDLNIVLNHVRMLNEGIIDVGMKCGLRDAQEGPPGPQVNAAAMPLDPDMLDGLFGGGGR